MMMPLQSALPLPLVRRPRRFGLGDSCVVGTLDANGNTIASCGDGNIATVNLNPSNPSASVPTQIGSSINDLPLAGSSLYNALLGISTPSLVPTAVAPTNYTPLIMLAGGGLLLLVVVLKK